MLSQSQSLLPASLQAQLGRPAALRSSSPPQLGLPSLSIPAGTRGGNASGTTAGPPPALKPATPIRVSTPVQLQLQKAVTGSEIGEEVWGLYRQRYHLHEDLHPESFYHPYHRTGYHPLPDHHCKSE